MTDSPRLVSDTLPAKTWRAFCICRPGYDRAAGFKTIWEDLRWDRLGNFRQHRVAYVILAYVRPLQRARIIIGSCPSVSRY
jgi:hypothetical protein